MLFEYAPPSGILKRFGLIGPNRLHAKRRALFTVLVGWAPLILLALIQTEVTGEPHAAHLVSQVSVHARYLIAAPLFVLAESVCAPQLNAVVSYFITGGIVGDQHRLRFETAVASTRKLLQAPGVEFLIVASSYVLVLMVVFSRTVEVPNAATSPTGAHRPLSLAGWWHLLVSLPLLIILILGWIWRLALWARLLARIARLDLRLLASHPDHCAGLSFLGHSLRAFSIVALALSTIVAGRTADFVLGARNAPPRFLYVSIGVVVATLLLLVAPLFIFVPTLMRTWRKATFDYGRLAGQTGFAFERAWLDAPEPGARALEASDFSATTDLYAIASNVYAIRFVPIDTKDVLTLIGALALPFVPVLLLAVPLNVILDQVKNLLF